MTKGSAPQVGLQQSRPGDPCYAGSPALRGWRISEKPLLCPVHPVPRRQVDGRADSVPLRIGQSDDRERLDHRLADQVASVSRLRILTDSKEQRQACRLCRSQALPKEAKQGRSTLRLSGSGR